MTKIVWAPSRRNDRPSIAVAGDTVTVSGIPFDFSIIGEGDQLPQEATFCSWFSGTITRVNGQLEVPMVLSFGSDAPDATRNAPPLENVADGVVLAPAFSASGQIPMAADMTGVTGAIDVAKLVTAADQLAQVTDDRSERFRRLVQAEIDNLVSPATRERLIGAHLSDSLTVDQRAAFLAGLGWIESMRTEAFRAAGANDTPVWPPVPSNVQALADTFT